MNRILNFLISPITTGVILIVGIIAMAAATFIENDFGAEVARQTVYNATWFELLMLLFVINLIGSIVKRKLYRKQKFTIFLFHIAFIVMIMGAAFTRYIGYEGMMHIREGESSSYINTQFKSLTIKTIENNQVKLINWPEGKVLRKSGFEKSFSLNNQDFDISLKYFYPSAIEKAIPVEGGLPAIGIVISNSDYKGFAYLMQGEVKQFGNTIIAYDSQNEQSDIYFEKRGDSLYIGGKKPIIAVDMQNSESVAFSSDLLAVTEKQLYRSGTLNLLVQEILPEALITAIPSDNGKAGKPALVVNIKNDRYNQNVTLWEGGYGKPNPVKINLGGTEFEVDYGYQIINLPFSLYLDNFEVARYPGSRSPSSYSSYVQILEPNSEPKPFHIYMNNILQMDGYRFYQSSYDNDEKGTILSVNYDSLGTSVTYIGYFLLFLGIILSMINKNSFLRNTVATKSLLILLFLGALTLNSSANANPKQQTKAYVSAEHAEKFGELLIQDNKGRTEPVYTLASDLLHKLSRKDQMFGLNAVQIFVEMHLDYQYWMSMPLIKVTNAELQKYLGINSNFASYNDFLSPANGYKLQDLVEKAYNTPPGKQSKMEKAVIKADEQMNICYSIYSGNFLKIFPIPNSDDHQWKPSHEAVELAKNSNDSAFLSSVLPVYFQELDKATVTNNYKLANEYLAGIKNYQQANAGYELPSDTKIGIEVKYYKWNVFKKLFPFYTTIGALFLFVLIGGIISGKGVNKWISRTFFSLILVGFTIHTIGLAVRWYISGHAPMSNGYESLVFIALITVLAGLIFSRQSMLALSATAVLAGFTLMVANLSFMDPEITNLVPVLKSYWLTIHVSVITGSYGFLGLGAILGLINLILILVQNKKNAGRINDAMVSLTKINHRTLILGLYFLSIGTFLGAVWANESWGRYWGWDPKETWSLITMIVYTFVTHARLIPGVKGIFSFNVLSVYAFFSVLMTYFGVNYYLSGLHSYAAGDPVPVPTFVYISVASIVVLSIAAYYKFQKNRMQ